MIAEGLAAAGCVWWFAVGALARRNLRDMRVAAEIDRPEPTLWPRVSLVIAAKDEAHTVERAVRSWLAIDYPDLEVIFVDDRSEDGTGDIARSVAAADPRVTVIRVDELPAGWLGKVNALARGAERATGAWLLMSDGDTRVAPEALRRAVAYAERERLDMLALVPEYDTRNVLVTVFWTVFLRVLVTVLAPRAIRDPRSRIAMGSGAFNLVRRSAFERTQGFQWLKLDTADDLALGMLIKRSGGRLEALDGRGLASVEIYRDVGDLVRGVEKNGGTTAAHPWRFTLGVLVFLALDYSPFAALALGPAWLRALGAVALVVATGVNFAALRRNTGRGLPALAWPLGTAFLAFATLRATWLVRLRGGVLWRGTFYPLDQIEAARRFEF